MKKLIIFLLLLISIPYVKAETIDLERKGSIELTLAYNQEEFIEGAEIEIIKIASLLIDNDSNIIYEYVNELDSCQESLKEIDKIDTNKIVTCSSNVIGIKKETNELGKVVFNDLDLGLYLVKQSKHVEGYSDIKPYLVTMPSLDSEWIYNIETLPKTEISKLIDINVKKVWNNNENSNPDSITFELRKGDEDNYIVIDTIILNDDIEWFYTFKQISESNDYYVKEIDVPNGYKDSYSYDTNTNTFIITNTAKLPQTGIRTYLIYIFLGLGIFFIGLSIYLEKRENRR